MVLRYVRKQAVRIVEDPDQLTAVSATICKLRFEKNSISISILDELACRILFSLSELIQITYACG